jgi:hypothetical protein
MQKLYDLIAILLFNFVWLVIVISGQKKLDFLSLIPAALFVAYAIWHFKLKKDIVLKILFLSLIGLGFDFLAFKLGLISFENIDFVFVPLWLIALWFAFGFSMPMYFRLEKKPVVLFILGFIFGPLSYLAGSKFDVLHFNSNMAIAAYAIFWGIYLPLSVRWMVK